MSIQHFKKQENSIQKQFRQRRKLLIPIVKEYGKPVIVHAIHDKGVFHKILQEGKLKLPKNHDSTQKTPYMERFLGIDNCIYYSLGFVYFSSYKWKYNLIFDTKYLKELVYYNNSANFQAARTVVNYLYENDKPYLDKLANTNATTRAVMDRYYNEELNGKVRVILEFWKIEKELFDAISNYPHKRVLLRLIREIGEKHFLKYPDSEKHALATYLEERAPEMIGKKENNLLKNPYFLGFYIDGTIERDTLAILKKEYPNKIIYDGKKIKKISSL